LEAVRLCKLAPNGWRIMGANDATAELNRYCIRQNLREIKSGKSRAQQKIRPSITHQSFGD